MGSTALDRLVKKGSGKKKERLRREVIPWRQKDEQNSLRTVGPWVWGKVKDPSHSKTLEMDGDRLPSPQES